MALNREELNSWIEYKPSPREWALIRLMSHKDGDKKVYNEIETG